MSASPRHDPEFSGTVARRVFWQSLTLQASWNQQRMQNLGLLAILSPWWRQLGLDRDQLRRACRRYFGLFNTNPYLANYVIGGLLRLEREQARGEPVSERLVVGFRDTLARACGSLGDQLFWMGLRPALMLLACLVAMAGWWPLVLLLIIGFAVAELILRWQALQLGFGLGTDVLRIIGRPGWHRAIAWLRRMVLILTGLVLGYFFADGLGLRPELGDGRLLGCLVVGLGLPSLVRQQASGETQLLAGLVVTTGLALVLG
jgi:mannose/fructose/N-acetylgalactosamine-specific phosphotransferase system component IID